MIEKNEIPVKNACSDFQIGKSSYYSWKKKSSQKMILL